MPWGGGSPTVTAGPALQSKSIVPQVLQPLLRAFVPGSIDAGVDDEEQSTNVTVSESWDAAYACQMRGTGATRTMIITLCDATDERSFCKSDGTCPNWPKPSKRVE